MGLCTKEEKVSATGVSCDTVTSQLAGDDPTPGQVVMR